MSEQLWMIEEAGCGARDVGRPVLWFTVTDGTLGALQVFRLDSDEATAILSAVYDVRDLNGRLARVDVGTGPVKFLGLVRGARHKP